MTKKKQDVKVLPYTPRVRMEVRHMWRVVTPWCKEYAKKTDAVFAEIDELAGDFIVLSHRLTGLNGAIGFEPTSKQDDEQTFLAKLEQYMSTDNMVALRALEAKMAAADRPSNPETAPTAEGLDPEV